LSPTPYDICQSCFCWKEVFFQIFINIVPKYKTIKFHNNVGVILAKTPEQKGPLSLFSSWLMHTEKTGLLFNQLLLKKVPYRNEKDREVWHPLLTTNLRRTG
jgi:hypothetical protein